MQEEMYTVTWHTYSDHLRDILREIKSEDSFADVTLVTDDKKQIKAHRNILSAFSSVFKDILQTNSNNNHPVLDLRGIQHSEMESILQFIYLGETSFHKDRMNDFFMVAKSLNIRKLGNSIEVGNFTKEEEDDYVEKENLMIKAVDQIQDNVDCLDDNKHVLKTESIGPELQCKQCNKHYTDERGLRRHIQSVHEGVKYACDQCHQQFTQPNSLKLHIQSLHEGIKFACNQCDKQYTAKDRLTRHIQYAHEGIRYSCDQCDYQSNTQGHLTEHIQCKHEGVKYPCNQCDYQATQQGSLKQHIQSVHEGVKFPCNQCDKQFRKGSLKTHIKTVHEGVKHTCHQCNQQFTRQDLLTYHIQFVHEGVYLACTQCDQKFALKGNLTKHIRDLHQKLK